MEDSNVKVDMYPIIEAESCHTAKEMFGKELVDSMQEENKDKEPEIANKLDSQPSISEGVLKLLRNGVLSSHIHGLKKLSSTLIELNRNQDAVISTLQQENSRFVETLKMYNLDDIFFKAKFYTSKLQQIKKDMSAVQDKSFKLQKRALRLQQQKQKEALHKELQRDQEFERDKQLAPKMATMS